jgi:hypothetical protein
MVERRLSGPREDARTDILRCRFGGDLFRGCGGGAERKKLTDAALCAEGLVVFASDFHSGADQAISRSCQCNLRGHT